MSNFGTLENRYFYGLKRLVFYLEDPQTTFSALICTKTNNKNVQIFDQNYGFLKNDQFRDFRKLIFLSSKRACFLSRISRSHIFRANQYKNKQHNKKIVTKIMD